MPQTPWITRKTQFNQETGQALLSDEATLVSFSQDFGKLINIKPAAVCIPQQLTDLQSIIQFAQQYSLPVTIRGNGLSQSGQSLPVETGITLSMQAFDKTGEYKDDIIWVEGNTTFARVLEVTLPNQDIPPVLPYNCNLSVGGVLSAGGVGASSFKFGPIVSQVAALEIVDGTGTLQTVDASSSLFQACLGGQGQFGIIKRAALRLRKCEKQLKTWCLVYDDMDDLLADFAKIRQKIDYAELFCSPCIQGSQLTDAGRLPLTQWLFGLHISMEFAEKAPDLDRELHPWKILHSQEESIHSWALRHNGRFQSMKATGQWEMLHPWYECFIPKSVLQASLPALLESLPAYYANMVQVVPIQSFRDSFFQLPVEEDVYAFMILNPGLAPCFKENTLKTMEKLDALFLPAGGKRYLSGYLGEDISTAYWKTHFGEKWQDWVSLKKQYDPSGVFRSRLFQGDNS